jgi:hypothetical protein
MSNLHLFVSIYTPVVVGGEVLESEASFKRMSSKPKIVIL